MAQNRRVAETERETLQTAVRNLASSAHLAADAIKDMDALTQVTSALPMSKLVYWERVIRNELAFASRERVDARPAWMQTLLPLKQPKEGPRINRFPTWMDVVSYDGHARERALRTLAGPAPNGFFLALAVRRLNDWVPDVRAVARQAVPELARTSDPEHVADMLCTILPTWTSWGRAEAADKAVLTTLVHIEGVAASLRHRIITSPAGPMPAMLVQVLRTDALDEDLAQIAVQAIQPAVRAQAYRALLLGKAVWVEASRWEWTDIRYCQGRMQKILGERTLQHAPALLASLQTAAADQAPLVRRVAAEALIREMRSLGDAGLTLASKLSTDASPPVAERGKFALKLM
ncbi:hypothetical protein FXN63_07385 [Pigmentiphaga aceris]|uniref:Uncharacterized protein n=1 Tax=Pigmentiphaga aceris TaxID=1940612 RepID=A0A5C0AWD5_9BURK|nr:hypothetical protein [Pigmentiphaga aceris]QEI05683.1 hypothetical protein FXN63_07385 [Pigmentiphaga aceris]